MADQIKRWTATRKVDVVMRIFRGESLDALSREIGVEVCLLEEWRNQAFQGMERGLMSRRKDPLLDDLDLAKKRIGELVMENELLEIKARRAPPFRLERSRK